MHRDYFATRMENQFMDLASQKALENVPTGRGGPFGAVIVSNGQIIATGANSVHAHTDPTAHGEVEAIRLACKTLGKIDLSDCELYTSAEPCPMCLGAIYWAHIPTVYYANTADDAAVIGFDDRFIYEELEKPIQERRMKMIRLESETAKRSFEAWRTFAAKVEY